MSPQIEAPNSVLLLVGREEFTPPSTFAGATCVATLDCIAVGVLNVDNGPTQVSFATEIAKSDLLTLGVFSIESEGVLSLRDVYNREYDRVGVDAGSVRITVLGNDLSEPCRVTFLLAPS